MQTSDFSFELPEDLIAQEPAPERKASRLMVLDSRGQSWQHKMVRDLPDLVPPGAVLVFNDSRVRRARVYGVLPTGARVEVLFQHPLQNGSWLALCTKSKKLTSGTKISFGAGLEVEVLKDLGEGLKEIQPRFPLTERFFEEKGHIPLPPYIHRDDDTVDEQRYQTVYSRQVGSVAAPTAGLHFDEALLEALRQKGLSLEFITLHVGLGTFLPVRSALVEEHRMHREPYTLSVETAHRLNEAKAQGRPILTVGTTSLRTLESNFRQGQFHAGEFDTDIFIYPGYQFQCVDALFTNFHTPESTLLMLVSAFAGRDFVLSAYKEAVEQRYRFFSYGDACLFLNRIS